MDADMILVTTCIKDSRTEMAPSLDFILRHPFPLPQLSPTLLGFLNVWAQCSTTKKRADGMQVPDKVIPLANQHKQQFTRCV